VADPKDSAPGCQSNREAAIPGPESIPGAASSRGARAIPAGLGDGAQRRGRRGLELRCLFAEGPRRRAVKLLALGHPLPLIGPLALRAGAVDSAPEEVHDVFPRLKLRCLEDARARFPGAVFLEPFDVDQVDSPKIRARFVLCPREERVSGGAGGRKLGGGISGSLRAQVSHVANPSARSRGARGVEGALVMPPVMQACPEGRNGLKGSEMSKNVQPLYIFRWSFRELSP
jgi:hypothetical protein